MAFLCTPGLSLVDGLQHAALSPRPLHWTGEEEWGGGGGDIGSELSLSKLETECPGKRDEQKNKCSSIDLPSCYVLQILRSWGRSVRTAQLLATRERACRQE